MIIPSIFSRLLAFDLSLRTFTKSFHALFGTAIVDSTRHYEHHTSPDGVQLAIPVNDQLSQNRLVKEPRAPELRFAITRLQRRDG